MSLFQESKPAIDNLTDEWEIDRDSITLGEFCCITVATSFARQNFISVVDSRLNNNILLVMQIWLYRSEK